jgi:hypothetical protein
VAEAAHAGRVSAAAAADERVHQATQPEPQQLQPVRRVQPLRHHGRRTLHHLQLQQGIQKVSTYIRQHKIRGRGILHLFFEVNCE